MNEIKGMKKVCDMCGKEKEIIKFPYHKLKSGEKSYKRTCACCLQKLYVERKRQEVLGNKLAIYSDKDLQDELNRRKEFKQELISNN